MDDSKRSMDDEESTILVSFDEAIEKIAKSDKLTPLKALEMLAKIVSTLYIVERVGGLKLDDKDKYVSKNIAMLVILNGLIIEKLGLTQQVNEQVGDLLAHYYQMACEKEKGGEETNNNDIIH